MSLVICHVSIQFGNKMIPLLVYSSNNLLLIKSSGYVYTCLTGP